MAEPDMVHVWSIDALLAPSLVGDLAALLDEGERRRASLFHHADDRRRYVVAHGAARVIIGRHLGTPPAQLRWQRGRHGKPELAGDWTGVRTNLSHSGDHALFALSDQRAIGVDVQAAPPGRDAMRLAARYFPATDTDYVATGDPDQQSDRFAQLWVRKEACVKAAGVRLVQGLPLPVHARAAEVVVSFAGRHYLVRDLPAPPGSRAAVAVAGARAYRVASHCWTP